MGVFVLFLMVGFGQLHFLWLAKLFYPVLHSFAHSYYVALAQELERLNCNVFDRVKKRLLRLVFAVGEQLLAW